MKFKVIFSFFYLFSCMVGQGKQVLQDFDKPAFYSVLASGNVDKINAELTVIGASSIHEKEAYEGVLLMKKAGLITKPADKLKFFKAGRIKLETSLARDSANGEYHFLRLIIQEHAPRIVKYSADLEKDSQIVHHTFKSLSPAAKQAIIDYSKKSKILRPEDF
ncbi:MAG TPA: hypothetical protein VF939_20490 [Puia sp.]